MTNVSSTLLSLLCVIGIGITSLSAQESCYEQYFREHGKEILPPIDESDNSYDELKKEVIARQVLRGEMPYAQYIADRYVQPTAKHGVPAQVLHKPLVLAIDTITGVCHLMAEDGTILADARIALVDSTWYMWLSVDPLADKYPGNTPYMYCNGNPIMLVDPDGRAAYYNDNGDFLGVDADGFTGRVYITDQETYSDLCDYNNVVGLPELQNSQLSAEAYSKIYTDILKQSDYGYSFDNVMGNAIAIYSVNGCYNDPQALRSSGVMANTQRWVDNNHKMYRFHLGKRNVK